MNEHTSPAFWPARGSLHEGRAFVLKEDVIFTVLAQEGGISWMNGRHPQSGGSFIIATAVSDEEEERATRLLKNEFALRDRLHDGWAIRPVASTQYRGRFALVYAPFCFELLACRAGKAISGIARFIEMAIRICGPLRQMHLHNLIHGDIKPGAFFVHHDATCRLCSFGLSCGTSDAFSQSRLAASGGTPAYMSPEHTTRTRRAVDSRSDLYSLGIVLYELLTGRLPFELSADDQTNWAHYHIASEPLAPGRVRPDVPGMLSTIILKLLEKNPENRYQTVDGLIADLRRCQATLTAEGEIVDFIPGQQDRSPAIHLADSLFSAHPQASDVIAAFERVSQSGAPELVTIGGPSGIGKSSVIATTLKSLQQRKVLLAVGKVDQYSPTLPYGVLSSAFRTLTLHLLGLPAGEVATWKIRLSRALEGFEELAANLLAEVYMRQSEIRLALEASLCWLGVFGIQISRYPENAECDEAWQQFCQRTADAPQNPFSQLKLMENAETEAVMNLLYSASIFASFTCPRLHFLLLCRMMHLTLDHGITGASTTAMAWFGVLIGHRYAEYRLGFEYGTLARELVNRHGYDAYEAKTLLPLDQLSVWTQPLSYTIECAKACFTSAVTHGDMTMACFAACHQIINFLSRGDHLDGVLTSIDRGLAFVRKTDYQDIETVLHIQRRYVEFLRTPVTGPWSAAQALPDDLLPAPPEQAPEQTSTMLFWYWLYRGMAHFSCGEYADAQADLEMAGWYAWSAPGHIHLLDYHFYSALALSRQLTPETFSADYRRSIHHHYDKIALWARINPGTFADKEALIYAEIVRLDGMNSIALEQYEKAVRLSREGGFNPINALAHELAGRFSLACGYPTASDAHFRGAIAAWGRVGAQAKVRQLEQDFPHLLASGQSRAYDTAAFAQNEVIRDLQSVIKASRALSEEINLERLIENLMTLLLERAGAQRGLLLRVSDNHIPEIEASAWTSTDGVRVRILKASPMATDMPLSVLAAVIRTGQEIRTGKPEEFHPFSQDPYLVTSGAAVMCVPMFKQARLVGILYLENRLMPEVFTAEHSRVVSLLGAQAAVSLETARLYAELLAENIQRRRVEKELRASQTSLMLGEQISHTGSWRWELVQDLMFMSEEYARILGLPEQQKMISMAEFLTFVHEDDYGRISTLVNQSVRDGLSMRVEFRIIRTDGSVRYLLGIGDPVGVGSEVNEYYGIITDITSQRAAEDAMRVAQADLARVSRATTVGQLTSSIAHEINQPLMSIVSNAGASLRWLNRDPARLEKVREGLEEIAAEGERAGEIIRSIQSLTRKQDPTFTRIDLHFLIHHIIMLSRSELELRHISVDYLLNADDSFIIGDSVQIQQVLLNLVMNAMEAMAEVTDRPCSITIATANCAEGKVIFEIADTGSGIEPELTERIFDSFYSTKAQGMGMGLTISASIIERHRGKLSARRREPYGTVFTFALPLAGQEM
ncbi:TPA: ATP-binding protein [Enterobacter hormaechei subsp. xiangfangensis]